MGTFCAFVRAIVRARSETKGKCDGRAVKGPGEEQRCCLRQLSDPGGERGNAHTQKLLAEASSKKGKRDGSERESAMVWGCRRRRCRGERVQASLTCRVESDEQEQRVRAAWRPRVLFSAPPVPQRGANRVATSATRLALAPPPCALLLNEHPLQPAKAIQPAKSRSDRYQTSLLPTPSSHTRLTRGKRRLGSSGRPCAADSAKYSTVICLPTCSGGVRCAQRPRAREGDREKLLTTSEGSAPYLSL